VIVCGIEAHVCVNQTVHDLLKRGYSPHVISDAVGSRSPKNKEVGLSKMVASGAVLSSVEMALFEMLIESGSEKFVAVQRLLK
jgi:nicotinamidase-related amidase